MVCKIAEMIYGIFLVVYRHISVVERLILMVAGLSPCGQWAYSCGLSAVASIGKNLPQRKKSSPAIGLPFLSPTGIGMLSSLFCHRADIRQEFSKAGAHVPDHFVRIDIGGLERAFHPNHHLALGIPALQNAAQ